MFVLLLEEIVVARVCLFWPDLLKLPFLEEFITPFVKSVKGNTEKSFYNIPEFEEGKKETANYNSWKIKFYKGLGTSTSEEAREYFSNLSRHRIKVQLFWIGR